MPNYGRLEDFDELAARHIDLKGKIVLARYGGNFRWLHQGLHRVRNSAVLPVCSSTQIPQTTGTLQGRRVSDRPLAA